MLGHDPQSKPHPSAHLTSDGSLANIEAMWTARNLKLYPIGVAEAVRRHFPAAESIDVRWRDDTVRLGDMTAWQLLNLRPEEALSLPDRIMACGYPESSLEVLRSYSVRYLGLLQFAAMFRDARLETMAFVAPPTAHYSIPKGASVLGLGDHGIVHTPIDASFRIDVDRLRSLLLRRLERTEPVVAVIAVIGTTEHGSVDPLADIADLRDELRSHGLDFHIHADAAYGGYFASALRESDDARTPPSTALPAHTIKHLGALARADSVTVDPHKSGYVHYPAGGLWYRDWRMPEMVARRAPVVFHAGEYPSVGSYTLEGSRPGSAAAAVWAAHKAVPNDSRGYGVLLSQSVLNSYHVRKAIQHRAVASEHYSVTWFFEIAQQDLNIFSFALNPVRNADARLANRLNDEVYAALALDHKGDDRPPVIVTGSVLDPTIVGPGIVGAIRARMKVEDDHSGLSYLICTIMNPFLEWTTINDLAHDMGNVIDRICVKIGGSAP
jgi:glutamate/tyrosine decarboxylase-like PLP-dependent enzyme